MSRQTTRELFIGARLSEVRDARDLTQDEVAARIGKSSPTISKWEHGKQGPEPEAVHRLAAALDVYPTYFQQPVPDHGQTAIFFRSLSNAAARARTRERARVRWLQHTSLALQATLDFPPINLPQAVKGDAYRRLGPSDLEGIAASLRTMWNLGEGPIPSMVLVAENAGAVVGVGDVGSMKIDGQGTWSTADGRPYILLARDKRTAFRRQMDVAHEIAHLILHREVTEDHLARDFDLIEDQAKYLACALLLPHRSFAAEVFSLSLDGFLALKQRWMVSVGAMIMRSHHLEMLSDEAAKRLWKYRATRGWHRREPLDLPSETSVEEPRLLRRCIEMIVDAKVRSKRSLLETDIGLGASDVEIMASLPPGYFSDGTAEIVPLQPRLREDAQLPSQSSVLPFRRTS